MGSVSWKGWHRQEELDVIGRWTEGPFQRRAAAKQNVYTLVGAVATALGGIISIVGANPFWRALPSVRWFISPASSVIFVVIASAVAGKLAKRFVERLKPQKSGHYPRADYSAMRVLYPTLRRSRS